jgi:hypothetical protein
MSSDARLGHTLAARALRAGLVLTLASGATIVQAQSPEGLEAGRFHADDPLWRDPDMRDTPPVANHDLSKSYDFLQHTFRGSSRGTSGPALNVNTLGEVPDSSWFTNRIGVRELALDEIVRGPNSNDGPAPGRWEVLGRPEAGITPKFSIRDGRGDRYVIKLDPADCAELPSSVEVISTKIFHALGYHVPEDFIVRFDPADLEPAPDAKMRLQGGKRRPFTRADIQQWLKRQPRGADGRIRALASRYVPGPVVGSFEFVGTRSDDPNDIYAHERRRELRALRVFAAWLNHDDARAANSLDVYVTEGDRRYLRHYLQDFGSTLGSGSTSPQQPRGGYEYLIERRAILKGLGGFGLWTRGWMHAKYPTDMPSLGNVEADFFTPAAWKTEYPQPAFDRMDAADGFWAASLVARFTDATLRAIVDTGQLTDERAAQRLSEILIARRDKVVAYWITATTPLDAFALSADGTALHFENAAVRTGASGPGATYTARWVTLDNATATETAIGAGIAAAEPTVRVPSDAWGPPDAAGDRYAAVAIGVVDPRFPAWKVPVRVTLRLRDGRATVVGVERPR